MLFVADISVVSIDVEWTGGARNVGGWTNSHHTAEHNPNFSQQENEEKEW